MSARFDNVSIKINIVARINDFYQISTNTSNIAVFSYIFLSARELIGVKIFEQNVHSCRTYCNIFITCTCTVSKQVGWKIKKSEHAIRGEKSDFRWDAKMNDLSKQMRESSFTLIISSQLKLLTKNFKALKNKRMLKIFA